MAYNTKWFIKKFGDLFTKGDAFEDVSKTMLEHEQHSFLKGQSPAMASKDMQDSSLTYAFDILIGRHRIPAAQVTATRAAAKTEKSGISQHGLFSHPTQQAPSAKKEDQNQPRPPSGTRRNTGS